MPEDVIYLKYSVKLFCQRSRFDVLNFLKIKSPLPRNANDVACHVIAPSPSVAIRPVHF